jgi:hypothetical protein
MSVGEAIGADQRETPEERVRGLSRAIGGDGVISPYPCDGPRFLGGSRSGLAGHRMGTRFDPALKYQPHSPQSRSPCRGRRGANL